MHSVNNFLYGYNHTYIIPKQRLIVIPSMMKTLFLDGVLFQHLLLRDAVEL